MAQFKTARLTDASFGNTIDEGLGAAETDAAAIIGVPTNTTVTRSAFEITAAGLKLIQINDATTAAQRLIFSNSGRIVHQNVNGSNQQIVAYLTDLSSGVVGPQGPQGAQGIQGIQGIQGATGLTGTNGTNGTNGAQGPQGDPGVTSCGQAEMRVSSGDVVTSANTSHLLAGGPWGFWVTNTSFEGYFKWQTFSIPGVGKGGGGSGTIGGTRAHATVRQFYITASPPYDLGDGHIPLFIFVLLERGSGKFAGAYAAPEAPWHYNGPTEIRADVGINGKPYKLIKPCVLEGCPKNPKRIAEYCERLKNEEPELIELTQEFKNRDMALIPQPFPDYDLKKYVVAMLDPMSPVVENLAALHRSREMSIVDMLRDGTLKVGNDIIEGRKGPPGVPIIGVTL